MEEEEEEGLDGKLMCERGERDEEGIVVVKAVGKYGGRQEAGCSRERQPQYLRLILHLGPLYSAVFLEFQWFWTPAKSECFPHP